MLFKHKTKICTFKFYKKESNCVVWFGNFSLNIIVVRFIHIAVCHSSFISTPEKYSLCDYCVFIRFLVLQWVSCEHSFMYLLWCLSKGDLCYAPRVELLGCMVCECLIFPKQLGLHTFPPAVNWISCGSNFASVLLLSELKILGH